MGAHMEGAAVSASIADLGFRGNIVASARAVFSAIAVPGITVAFALASIAFSPSRQTGSSIFRLVFVGLLSITWAGWFGVERIFFLRRFRQQDLGLIEGVRLVPRFIPRYLLLAVLSILPIFAIAVAQFVTYRVAPYSLVPGSTFVRIAMHFLLWLGAWLAIDIVLTFVTPALAYTTTDAIEGLRVGWRFMKAQWPSSAPYALIPMLALFAVSLTAAAQLPLVARLAVAAASALVTLIFKGATARFYLSKLQHEVSSTGSATADQRMASQGPDLAEPNVSKRAQFRWLGGTVMLLGIAVALLWPTGTSAVAFSRGVSCGGPLRVVLLGPRTDQIPASFDVDSDGSVYREVKADCRHKSFPILAFSGALVIVGFVVRTVLRRSGYGASARSSTRPTLDRAMDIAVLAGAVGAFVFAVALALDYLTDLSPSIYGPLSMLAGVPVFILLRKRMKL